MRVDCEATPSNANNNIFSEYYETQQSVSEHLEFFLDDEIEQQQIQTNTNSVQKTRDLVLNDYEFDDIGDVNDDYSSGADYFLASSVDTVVNAPYLMMQLNANKNTSRATSGAINVNLTNPVLASQSQSSFSSSSGYQSSYTHSVAKNFLIDNKMNVNSNKGNHLSRQHEDPLSSSAVKPSIPAETNKQANTKGKTFINNIKKLLKKKNTTRVRWNAYF